MFTVIAPVCQILFHTAKITKHAENKFQWKAVESRGDRLE
jgi:hypothetical protein